MAAFEPFEPKTGKTVAVISSASGSSISVVIDCTNIGAFTMLVTNMGPNMAWVRMTNEAAPTATLSDTPMLGNTVLLLANPVPNGKVGVAVMVSVTTSPNTVWFTPGEGGV